jgi:prepilin-type N-terminal cleavage/methylation domain-containing protein
MNFRRGFTLIEVIVILAVISILAAVVVPTALRIFQVTAENTTREEMQELRRAMIGDERKLQGTFRSDFGFLGDVGRIPSSLDEILTPASLPAFTFDSSKLAGAGWNGPYVTGAAVGEEAEEFKEDQLGNLYDYSDVDYTNASGQLVDGKITSAGPDGVMGTADDITMEILKSETTATVVGTVKDTAGNGLEAVPVEFYAAVNGTLTTTPATTDANGVYSFVSVPFGQRAISARPLLVYSPGSVTTASGGQDISFKLVNYSTSPYTITQIRAEFTGGANYDQVRINGITVDSNNNIVSGQTVNVTSTGILASPAARPSLRVFVDSPNVQVPIITISGQGTVATIELNSFSSDVRGIPITVTFNPSGTRSIVKFTPQ